ncbi:methylated-DNA--[protein]-cysteine S-methyltransferase [Actinocrispum wychmicini]|uniref:Methylated-DNA--protein-cysteine methyltransferase n=1 Tax=Actinocrispum wychmicini TaxID=1213861 RepID=A0A4R2J6B6_9PSEU|nr:methylated-DNA--[protein]-cysteine S-methyltransferase [Actinocrispum wychmicini]TCO53577.1 methylated-DNA-[protein]-cysteine S-methyltransferase [Actinocrispum wychmicini]
MRAVLDTPVGRLSVTETDAGLAAVGWTAKPTTPPADSPAVAQLREYFRGERHRFDLDIDWTHTTGLQQEILKTLYSTVDYGASVTYGELAARSGTGVPARGIGSIMGANPIPIVVPCHRVVAHDGLGGYSGGTGRDRLEVKRWLLTMEGALPPTLDWSPDGIQ